MEKDLFVPPFALNCLLLLRSSEILPDVQNTTFSVSLTGLLPLVLKTSVIIEAG